ncbi:hypothetical protein [Chitinibacter sp. S2-10]|uniref:hypothetical protein n=1 Tax=Chitinibacter sp. S2-10 TaxID=3373597 RepID=UPI0039776EEE
MNHLIKTVCLAASLALSSLAMAEATPCPGMGPGMQHGMRGEFAMPKGEVKKADFLKRMEARFDAIDSNKDGVLSEAERKTAHDQMRAKRGEMRKNRSASQPCMAQ